MLDRIHVENYKCLRDVTVDLGDFTILIGPNDSGKTSFLEVIQSFGTITRQSYSQVLIGDKSLGNLVWRKDSALEVNWEATGKLANDSFTYRVQLPVGQRPARERFEFGGKKLLWTDEAPTNLGGQQFPRGTLVVMRETGQAPEAYPAHAGITRFQQLAQGGQPPYAAISQLMTSSTEYHFELGKLPAAAVPLPGIVLARDGSNLAGVLDVLQNSPDRSSFEAIQKSLHEAIPTLAGIVLPPAGPHSGAKALEFILSGNGQSPVTIPGSLASGGALLLTAFLTLAYTETASLLLFEEPENGLHPVRLQMVLDILRKMSRGEVGNRKRQIVITTHNPLLLNYANPEEVRVFVRHPAGDTKVFPMTEAHDINRLLKEFSLGELWYLLGEEKLFEGQTA